MRARKWSGRRIWTLVVAGYFGIFCACAVLTLSQPRNFAKVASLARGGDLRALKSGPSVDIAPILARIPYQSRARTGFFVWAVNPQEKYRKTIEGGLGNCSNMTLGMAYLLDSMGVDFQIIDILPRTDFFNGSGHSIVRTHVQLGDRRDTGLVDVMFAGVLEKDQRVLDVADLIHGDIRGVTVTPLNTSQNLLAPDYDDIFNNVAVSYRRADDVRKYFRFVESIYVPLGSPRLEKYLYEGIAVLAGVYPRRFVFDYDAFAAGYRGTILPHRFSLLVYRSSVVMFPLLCVIAVVARRRQARGCASADS